MCWLELASGSPNTWSKHYGVYLVYLSVPYTDRIYTFQVSTVWVQFESNGRRAAWRAGESTSMKIKNKFTFGLLLLFTTALSAVDVEMSHPKILEPGTVQSAQYPLLLPNQAWFLSLRVGFLSFCYLSSHYSDHALHCTRNTHLTSFNNKK